MVWKYRVPFNQAWVLMALADHADDDGTNCYPAIAYVAWKTGYSERQVRRVMKQLRDTGALIVLEDNRGPGFPVHYQVNLEALTPKSAYVRPMKYLPQAARVKIIALYGRTCAYCEVAGTATLGPDGRPWHIDRIVPASQGGTYEESNVALACGTCNRKKGAKLAQPQRMPSSPIRDAVSDPSGAIAGSFTGATQEAVKPSSTLNQPSEEPSVATMITKELWSWLETLRAIDGWKLKGEPHLDSLLAWVLEKGWTEEQLEASAIGLAATSDKVLKGYRTMAGAFQRRLNQGYDRIPVDGRGPGGNQAQQTSGRADGWDGTGRG